jgi:glucokinase
VPAPSRAGRAVVGLDVGGTKILGIAYAVDGRADAVREGAPAALGVRRVPTPTGTGELFDALVSLIESFRLDLERTSTSLAAVGLGVPGLVDRTGTLRVAPNLPGVEEIAVGNELGARVGLPVAVENDATCAAWAEHLHGAAQVDDALLVTLGTGIGAGYVAGGVLQRGANGFAGEAGHMVVDPTGPPCPCGRRGCWERYASGSGLGRLGRDAALAGKATQVVARAGGDPENVRGEHVAAAARAGDHDALAIIEEFAGWFALGLANLVNLLDPEVAVIGGGLAEAADLFIEPIRNAYVDAVYAARHRPPLRIEVARIGPDAGALGAALLARDVLTGGAR